MLSRTALATLSVSAVSANSSSSSRLLLFNFNNSNFLGFSNRLSSIALNPLSNYWSLTRNANNNSKQSYRKSRMSGFTTRASAEPLKNADELIDSVETFIFDCDGEIDHSFLFISCCYVADDVILCLSFLKMGLNFILFE